MWKQKLAVLFFVGMAMSCGIVYISSLLFNFKFSPIIVITTWIAMFIFKTVLIKVNRK